MKITQNKYEWAIANLREFVKGIDNKSAELNDKAARRLGLTTEQLQQTSRNGKKSYVVISEWSRTLLKDRGLIDKSERGTWTLTDKGIRTNVTLVFSVSQALMAAKAGATYLSNFVGRVDDNGADGMDAVRDTVEMVNTYGFDSEVLVASVRHPLHVLESIRAGAHVATMPLKTLEMMFKHPMTDSGLDRFLADWNKAGLSIF